MWGANLAPTSLRYLRSLVWRLHFVHLWHLPQHDLVTTLGFRSQIDKGRHAGTSDEGVAFRCTGWAADGKLDATGVLALNDSHLKTLGDEYEVRQLSHMLCKRHE